MSRPDPDCPLIGTWKLQGWEMLIDGDDPTTAPPDWENVQGQIMYAPDGQMSMHMSNADREPFVDVPVWGGTPAEISKAFDDYRAYAGTFRWEGERVTHIIEQSIFPNIIGSDQVRLMRIEGSNLILGNVAQTLELTWKRVD